MAGGPEDRCTESRELHAPRALVREASLYGYFGTTIIVMLFVRTLPPYTSNRWLA